jgi:hypothetical protein
MNTPHLSCPTVAWNLNLLRRGASYRATTRSGSTTGEYLGMEAPHGDRAILLRHGAHTESIPLSDVTGVVPAAA